MKFTGIYATYYQDVCKRWDKVIAKCKTLEGKPTLYYSYPIEKVIASAIKAFDREVAIFNETTIVDDRHISIRGQRIYKDYPLSETLVQIRCIYGLRLRCFAMLQTYYERINYSDITSWDDYDALFREIEKEYGFMREMLKLFITELRNMGKSVISGANAMNDVNETYEKAKKDNERAALRRRLSSPEFRQYSKSAVNACSYCYSQSYNKITFEHIRR